MNLLLGGLFRLSIGVVALALCFAFWLVVGLAVERGIEIALGHPILPPEEDLHWLTMLAMLVLVPLSTYWIIRRVETSLLRRLGREN